MVRVDNYDGTEFGAYADVQAATIAIAQYEAEISGLTHDIVLEWHATKQDAIVRLDDKWAYTLHVS